MDGLFSSSGPEDALAAPVSPDDTAGPPPRVMVLAATNHPWDLDEALRRRLEKRVLVPLPDAAAREAIFSVHLRGVPLAADLDLAALAALTAGLSGSDIRAVCRDAAMAPVRRLTDGRPAEELVRLRREGRLGAGEVRQADLESAARAARPTVAEAEARRHAEWAKRFGSGGDPGEGAA